MFGYYNEIVQEDLQSIASEPLDWHEFDGKTVLITGATGMLATYITFIFLYLREKCGIKVRTIALCRTRAKADTLFESFYSKDYFSLLLQDVCTPLSIGCPIDYIFHLAGNASPYYINHTPVDILKTNLVGTINVLELAREKKSKVFFASTREVYGKNENVGLLKEESFGSLDPIEQRSCYPESKRAAESLMKSYQGQYGVDVYIVRIAHSYGPGMNTYQDGRIMADLIGNAMRGEDIVLKSEGKALRAFCYVTDTIRGIFYLVMKGKNGKAYNLSNETEEIEIRQLADILATLSKGHSKVIFDIPQNNTGYCNYQRVGLDNHKIEALGWKPQVRLVEGLKRTIESQR